MAIRIRIVNGLTVALCAARSMPQPDDIYLDDAAHTALVAKFACDFNEMWGLNIPHETELDSLMEREESNNPNREWWNSVYAPDSAERGA